MPVSENSDRDFNSRLNRGFKMVHALQASATSILLDQRCILGRGVCIAPAGHMAGRWSSYARGRRGTAYRAQACGGSLAGSSNETTSSLSWSPTHPVQCDGFGGWSHGGVVLETERRKGIKPLFLVGAGTSLAICLALLAQLTFSNKGFRARLYAPVAGLHQLLMPLSSRVLAPVETVDSVLAPAETVDPSLFGPEVTVPSSLNNENQGVKDHESTKIEVSRVPASKAKLGIIVIPAAVDPAQCEALSILEKLKIVEPHVEPGDLCSRREYARWLVKANCMLARSPSDRVFPSVYIEGVTIHAFDDVPTQDPDFPYIQGLAETGVVPSKLSVNNRNGSIDDKQDWSMFYPDSPLSRLDLVSWKMVLEHKLLPEIDRRTLEKKSGFLDVDRICIDAWPAIFMDVLAGDQSVTRKTFGYSRRFQPDKPVTKGQAAIVITSGQTAGMVSEELSKLEAENLAKEEVIKEIVAEMLSKGEIKSFWEEKLGREKAKILEAEKMLEFVVSELEKEKAERERWLPLFLKEKAMLEFEQKLLSSLKLEVDELKEAILVKEREIRVEGQELEKLQVQSKLEKEALSNAKSLAEAEKRALALSRLWIEDEARQIQAQGEILAEAVKRWKFSEDFVTCPCTCHCEEKTKEDAPQEEYKSGHVSSHQFWHLTEHTNLNDLQQMALKTVRELGYRAQDLQNSVFSAAGEKATGVQRLLSSISAQLLADAYKILQKLGSESAGSGTRS